MFTSQGAGDDFRHKVRRRYECQVCHGHSGQLSEGRSITWEWLKAHVGDDMNGDTAGRMTQKFRSGQFRVAKRGSHGGERMSQCVLRDALVPA